MWGMRCRSLNKSPESCEPRQRHRQRCVNHHITECAISGTRFAQSRRVALQKAKTHFAFAILVQSSCCCHFKKASKREQNVPHLTFHSMIKMDVQASQELNACHKQGKLFGLHCKKNQFFQSCVWMDFVLFCSAEQNNVPISPNIPPCFN